MNNQLKITESPVWTLLFKMTFPMIFGMLGIVAFNMVDTFYVSKLGLTQMAAMTLTFPVVMIVGALAQGIGIGGAALISKAQGEHDIKKVTRYSTDSLILGLILVFIFVVFGLFTIDPLFTLLGADSETLIYVKEYMQIWYGGVIFLVIPMIGNSAIRAIVDTKTPAVIMTVSAVINMIFDPILIFGLGPIPALGISGAAIATVIARAVTLVVSFSLLRYKFKIISIRGSHLHEIIASFKALLFVGIPNALTRIMTPLAVGVITGLIATFGKESTAGFGIATRIEMFAMIIINSMVSIFVPLLGQNLGAKKMDRVHEIINKAGIFSLAYSVLAVILLALFGRNIAQLFTDNETVINTVRIYLLIIPLGYGLQGLFLIYTSALNVINKPIHSAAYSLLRLFIVYVPLALVLSKLWALTGIWIALNASFLITVVFIRKALYKQLELA